ncbi:Predicted acetyltransferase involved in intracellular survival and related acetyltransferases [Bordetella ansorpii]|uniref:Predicted acetyltransferase involved in intracellular survival and related acetyltransferases n=2 Tax=Bordetella ansorpii TaxID=288768 RepID=A0A157PA49_9BORD|nr:Predicted acetyltransferase involved in intracellular survival and related acetyltransferases [Bordetella ansorpii]
MRQADIPAGWRLSNQEHWPHRVKDWQAFFALGRGCVVQAGDDVAGIGMCWQWGVRAATLGMVLVSPAHRGQGVGSLLFDALCEMAPDSTLLLHATPMGERLYERAGFQRVGIVHQCQGIVAQDVPTAALPDGAALRLALPEDLDLLADLDARARGMPRRGLMQQWQQQATATVMLSDPDGLRGFAMLRRFGKGLIIGPVAADDEGCAKALIAYLANQSQGQFLRVDCDAATGLTPWLEASGLAKVSDAVVMARGAALPVDAGMRLFAIGAQALG